MFLRHRERQRIRKDMRVRVLGNTTYQILTMDSWILKSKVCLSANIHLGIQRRERARSLERCSGVWLSHSARDLKASFRLFRVIVMSGLQSVKSCLTAWLSAATVNEAELCKCGGRLGLGQIITRSNIFNGGRCYRYWVVADSKQYKSIVVPITLVSTPKINFLSSSVETAE